MYTRQSSWRQVITCCLTANEHRIEAQLDDPRKPLYYTDFLSIQHHCKIEPSTIPMRYRRSSRVWRSSRPPPWLPIPAIPPISRVKQQVALSSLFAFIIIVLLLIHTVGYSHGKQGFVESWWTWNRTRISPLRHADRSNDNREHSTICRGQILSDRQTPLYKPSLSQL